MSKVVIASIFVVAALDSATRSLFHRFFGLTEKCMRHALYIVVWVVITLVVGLPGTVFVHCFPDRRPQQAFPRDMQIPRFPHCSSSSPTLRGANTILESARSAIRLRDRSI